MAPTDPLSFPNPTQALVFYLQSFSCLVSLTDTLLSTTVHPALDETCMQGCCGTIALEPGLVPHQDDNASEFIQLLGIFGCKNADEMKQQLKKRFGKLSLGLLTTSPTLHTLSTTLSFAHAEHLPNPPPAVTLAHHIQSLLSANSQSTTTPIDVLFIHLSPPVPASPDAYRPLIDLVDAVFAALLDTTPKVLKIALTSWAADEPSGRANTLYLDPPTDLDERASFLRPKQSHVTKDGEEVAVDTTRGPITALYHHHGSTRRDAAARFTEREVLERGENGRILAWHFLAEVGYKLGFVPKYGA